MSKKNELNSLQIKELLRYFIKNNVKLSEKSKTPVAIEIEGMPGTAKTSVVKQVGEELDYHFVRLNLSEIEVCDLVGLPIYEYKIGKNIGKKEEEILWVSDKVINQYMTLGFHSLNENRTSYSKPSWIQGKEDKPVLLTLDDCKNYSCL